MEFVRDVAKVTMSYPFMAAMDNILQWDPTISLAGLTRQLHDQFRDQLTGHQLGQLDVYRSFSFVVGTETAPTVDEPGALFLAFMRSEEPTREQYPGVPRKVFKAVRYNATLLQREIDRLINHRQKTLTLTAAFERTVKVYGGNPIFSYSGDPKQSRTLRALIEHARAFLLDGTSIRKHMRRLTLNDQLKPYITTSLISVEQDNVPRAARVFLQLRAGRICICPRNKYVRI